ncbi:hypothetical protein SCP_0700210 [Sparassis crispa]|uniref:Telomere-associated protein Rif1 N-terminal domain-containing protein n=1 Tax=Sparassis crispa TaxID=139825 RepID=A0A401GRG9_9APHY|nr:hypothetical protein SCP_0700210 [Sparassis crispa]GBE84841.1 hypothetical protein SCP_0700210 [Sparassis crispa]
MSFPPQTTRSYVYGDAPGYFRSPIATLRESLEDDSAEHISAHDLLEAYSVFSSRLRTIVAVIPEDQREVPSLNYVARHAPEVAQCLRRDLRRALVDPVPNYRSSNDLIPESLAFRDATEDQVKDARDASSVCHGALRLLSYIFRFSVLSSMFTPNDVASLLDDVLKTIRKSSLPIPNESKTVLLTTWVVSKLRLSTMVMSSKKQQIKDTLKAAVEGGKPELYVIDSLKACYHLLTSYPLIFFEPFVEVLPLVMARLISPSAAVRTQAANALSGYVLASLSDQAQSLQRSMDTVRHHIYTFIDSQRSSKNRIDGILRLEDMLSISLTVDHPAVAGQGPVWCLIVLACIATLLAGELFTRPHSLKLVMTYLARNLAHQRSFVRKLHACVWRCLIWAFVHVSRDNDTHFHADRRIISASQSSSDLRERAFCVVRQELGQGTGIALVSCLLQPPLPATQCDIPSTATGDLSKALGIVRDMVSHGSQSVHSEGVALLTRLISSIGTAAGFLSPIASDSAQHEGKIIVKELFDRSLLKADWDKVPQLVSTIGQYNVEEVRQLTEAEIVCHWEDLFEIWGHCVERTLSHHQPVGALSSDLLQVWQALLLVQAQLTQEYGHLTTASSFANRAVTIITDFLLFNYHGSSDSSQLCDRQCARLTLVRQLWRVMKNVFTTSWLIPTATSILTSVLKQEYKIDREDVKVAWSGLCAALISASEPDLLGRLVIGNESQRTTELIRHLWNVSASKWTTIDPKPSWQDTVSFLVVPLGVWVMSDEENGVWNGVLDYAAVCAESLSTSSLKVVETLVLSAAKQSKSLLAFSRTSLIILAHLRPTAADIISAELFSHINEYLSGLYSRQADFLQLAMDALKDLRSLFKCCPRSLLIPVLTALSDGLCVWIKDESEIMLEEEYNDVVMTLYTDTLDLLRGHPFSADTLRALAPFISSGFCRLVHPAWGPVAFKAFWDSINPGIGSLIHVLPGSIKECLKTYQEAFGASLPSDISFDSESSQSQSQSQSDNVQPELPAKGQDDDRSIYPVLRASVVGADTSSTEQYHAGRNPTFASLGLTQDSQSRNYSDTRDINLRFDMIDSPDSRRSSGVASILSPEVPFVGAGMEHINASPGMHSPSPAVSNAIAPVSPLFDASYSVFVPSSPTPAKRASLVRDLRPPKRIKTASTADGENSNVDPNGKMSGILAHRASFFETTLDMAHGRSSRFDCVEVPTYAEVRRMRSRTGSAAPHPTPGYAGPSITRQVPPAPIIAALDTIDNGEASPRTPRAMTPPASEDYENWETALDTAQLQRIQRDPGSHSPELDHDEFSVSEQGEDDACTPCRHRSVGKGKSIARTAPPNIAHGDTVVFSNLAHRADTHAPDHPVPPERSQTAPALSRALDPAFEVAPPLRRARTISTGIDALRQAYDAVQAEGSQMPVDEMLAATKLVHDIGRILNEKLLQRLGVGGKGDDC